MSDINRTYELPTEINAPMKIKSVIPLSTIISFIIIFAIAQKMNVFVYEGLEYVWYVWNILVAILISINSQNNIGKIIGSAILLYLSRDEKTYHSIDNPVEYEKMKRGQKAIVKDKENYKY